MGTTETADWPAPIWPALRLEASRAAAAREPNSLQGILGRIRLHATDGDLPAARGLLCTFLQDRQGHNIPARELRQIIPIALLIHDQEAARQLLNTAFPVRHHIVFTVARNLDGDVLSMQIDHDEVTFALNVSLIALRQGEILIQRFVDAYPILGRFLNSSQCVNGAVTVNLGDAGHMPGLTFCDGRSGYFLIPDSIFLDAHGYSRLRGLLAASPTPWERRAPVAFWRGTTTGLPPDNKLGWRSLPRIRLCELAASHPDLIDAGLTQVVQIDDPTAEVWIGKAGLLRPYAPPESFQRYKYQIDIDGNTTSWPGLFMKLLTGSAVLKVPPRNDLEQWYYDHLKPWTNFIPLAADMSDLPDKVIWLRNNDRAAQTIGEAGRRLAESLTYEREIARATPVVAAAVKDAAGAPVLALSFDVGSNGVGWLREGWHQPERSGVAAATFQSRIELPRPHGIGGFVLSFDVSPAVEGGQRVSIALDGNIVEHRCVAGRATIHVPLSRRMLMNKAALSVTFLLPDARPAASPALPGDCRVLSLELHTVTAQTAWRTDLPADPAFQEAAERLHYMENDDTALDVPGMPILMPPDGPPVPLYTHHGTLAYIDLAAGCLRHGDAATIPHNLLLATIRDLCVLIRIAAGGQHRILALRPEGPLATAIDPTGLDQNGRVQVFTPIWDEQGFALQAAGMVLCAEPSGLLRLSRTKIGPWERFRTTSGVN